MRYSRRGISIIETTIALLILATIGGALLALNVQIQSAANSSKFKSVAESEAQQMLEQVRGKKNAAGGISGLPNGCFTDASLITGCPPGIKTYVNIADSNGGKQIKSVVGWTDKGKNYSLELDTYLYDY